MYSLVISTIGCPFLLDSLASLTYPPDDVLVVVDMIGRQASTLERDYPLDHLGRDLNKHHPGVRLLFNQPEGPWAVMNGCYNLGARAARNPFVWFTHDDIEYPDFDFPRVLKPVLSRLAAEPLVKGRRVVGLVLQEHEVLNGVNWPDYPVGTWGLGQCVSPVSQIVSVAALEEMGGFDEKDGIWYDGHLEMETRLRDWWYLLLPTPLIRHTSNRTYQANNWGDRWAANPIWGHYEKNFVRRYGVPFVRQLPPIEPITDPRLGIAPC